MAGSLCPRGRTNGEQTKGLMPVQSWGRPAAKLLETRNNGSGHGKHRWRLSQCGPEPRRGIWMLKWCVC
jgi:hypothetical protein